MYKCGNNHSSYSSLAGISFFFSSPTDQPKESFVTEVLTLELVTYGCNSPCFSLQLESWRFNIVAQSLLAAFRRSIISSEASCFAPPQVFLGEWLSGCA